MRLGEGGVSSPFTSLAFGPKAAKQIELGNMRNGFSGVRQEMAWCLESARTSIHTGYVTIKLQKMRNCASSFPLGRN